VPCGGAAFILCSIMDSIFEFIGLLNKEFKDKRYCMFVHESEIIDEESSDFSNKESLLSGKLRINN